MQVLVEHLSVLWTTGKPAENRWGDSSRDFTVAETSCYFRLANFGIGTADYRLYIDTRSKPPDPFQVTVHLSKEAVLFLSQSTTITNAGSYEIWRKSPSEVWKVMPNFQEQEKFSFHINIRRAAPEVLSEHKSDQTPIYLDPKFQLEKLSVDFAKLLDGEDSNPDVEVLCGGRTCKAHRNVLSSRSDVFKAMLQSDMLEGKTGRVEVRDVDSGLFEQFLEHMHTGRLLELTVDTAMSFYEIADRYAVEGVKQMCASFLTDRLSLDNACSILSLADRHSDEGFRQSAVAYVLGKKIPLYKEYWSDFCKDRPQLAIDIYDQFLQLHISKLI